MTGRKFMANAAYPGERRPRRHLLGKDGTADAAIHMLDFNGPAHRVHWMQQAQADAVSQKIATRHRARL